MSLFRQACLVGLTLLTGGASWAQDAQDPKVFKDALKATALPSQTAPSNVHIFEIKHADLNNLLLILGRVFEVQVKNKGLVLVGDENSHRLIVNATDDDLVRVRDLVEELDREPQNAPRTKGLSSDAITPSLFGPLNGKKEPSLSQQLVEKIRASQGNERDLESLRTQLATAVDKEFAEQQTELQSELTKLQTKMESLKKLLAKREANKKQICEKRIVSLLGNSGQPGLHPENKNSSLNPLVSNSVPIDAISQPPLRSNRRTGDQLPLLSSMAKAKSVLQARLSTNARLQIVMKGSDQPIPLRGLTLQLSEVESSEEFELLTIDNKRMTAVFKMDCIDADAHFWNRMIEQNINIEVNQDDIDRVLGNQLIVKALYLPHAKDGKIQTLASYEVDPGVDVRSQAAKLGQPILSFMLSQSIDKSIAGASGTRREVCFINDSDQATLFTVVTGQERIEKRLDPHSHMFVKLGEQFEQRVVLMQAVDKPTESPSTNNGQVQLKVLSEKLDQRWNFCFVHGSVNETIQMDLMGYVCLDVVPLTYDDPQVTKEFPQLKSRLLDSLKSTTEIEPETKSFLKQSLKTFSPHVGDSLRDSQ